MARHVHLDELDLEELNAGETIQRGPVRIDSITDFLGATPTVWEPTPLEFMAILDALFDGQTVTHGACRLRLATQVDHAMVAEMRQAVAACHKPQDPKA